MWGKWVFPTSHDPLHHPLNYGCRLFPVEKGLVDLEDFSSFVTRRRDRRFHKIPKNRGNVVRRPFSQGSWTNQPSKRKNIFRLPGSYRLGRFFVARMRNVASRRAGRDLEVSRNSTEEAK